MFADNLATIFNEYYPPPNFNAKCKQRVEHEIGEFSSSTSSIS